MSVYLLIKRELWVKGLIATAVVALAIHWMADPVPGLGIAVPVFMPALVTAAIALLLSRKDAPPPPPPPPHPHPSHVRALVRYLRMAHRKARWESAPQCIR